MPHTKNIQSKNKVKAAKKSTTTPDLDELINEPPVAKIQKVIDVVDIHDDISGTIEEKPEVDLSPGEEDADEAGEEGLDDDEVNPFGDKWEV